LTSIRLKIIREVQFYLVRNGRLFVRRGLRRQTVSGLAVALRPNDPTPARHDRLRTAGAQVAVAIGLDAAVRQLGAFCVAGWLRSVCRIEHADRPGNSDLMT
jgi:hypothetical protein